MAIYTAITCTPGWQCCTSSLGFKMSTIRFMLLLLLPPLLMLLVLVLVLMLLLRQYVFCFARICLGSLWQGSCRRLCSAALQARHDLHTATFPFQQWLTPAQLRS